MPPAHSPAKTREKRDRVALGEDESNLGHVLRGQPASLISRCPKRFNRVGLVETPYRRNVSDNNRSGFRPDEASERIEVRKHVVLFIRLAV